MNTKRKNAFTLVELLAVIVILAIVLVIAVPKILSVITDSKKATLESTAKMIASAAEKAKMQNTVLGNTEDITCESVAKLNDIDYASCKVEFEGNTAKVTIQGSGKFAGLNVCGGSKTNSIAQKEVCSPKIKSIEVEHPTFLRGQAITAQQFKVNATYADGSTRVLESQERLVTKEDGESTTITSPNWPNNYPVGMTESENYWEVSYEGATSMQITFDATSETVLGGRGQEGDFVKIYDKNGALAQTLSGTISDRGGSKIITVSGDYIKITMESVVGDKKGFSATVKPMYNVPPEYTVSPVVVPNTGESFDITITVTGQNISKKISTKSVHKIGDYVASDTGAKQMTAQYNGTQYDAGIRYTGSSRNNVYYNCEEIDSKGVSYGNDNYDYASSCEVWNIIGLFDVEDGKGNTEKRVKIVNNRSTFTSVWDASEGGMDDKGVCSGINCGNGINQWGESIHSDGTPYEGADLMRFLNGYYIGKEGTTCTYIYMTSTWTFETEERTCTVDSLKAVNMKPLTSIAKKMIGNAVWYTYAVDGYDKFDFKKLQAEVAYLEEKGISKQFTGKICTSGNFCNDTVIRTTSWTGLVGMPSASDMAYSDGWVARSSTGGWSITPQYNTHKLIEDRGDPVWFISYSGNVGDQGNGKSATMNSTVAPTVYLLPDVKIVGKGAFDGMSMSEPYILSI